MEEFVPQFEEVTSRVRRLRVPVPFPTRWVNVYLVADGAHAVLVDTGYPFPQGREILRRALEQARVHLAAILITHAHPDHFGMARELQAWFGCPVWMAAKELEVAWAYRPEGEVWKKLEEQFHRAGMPPEGVAQTVEAGKRIWERTPPPRVDRFLEEGEEVRIGGRRWEVLVTPGHAPAHICLYDGEVLLAGDHLLGRITPNIGLWPLSGSDPLADFLTSLKRLKAVRVRMVLPGHGDPYEGYRERVTELIAHHLHRLQEVEAVLQAGPKTPYEVHRALFGPDLDPHNERFGLVEAMAHLRYLHGQGRVREEEQGGTVRYRLSRG